MKKLLHIINQKIMGAKAAFSLVELSIVLVILGLLVGGVLSGQALIRASEIRAVSTEFQLYQTALGTFRGKYFALPGDMINAVSFWGAAAGGTAPGVNATCAGLDHSSAATDGKTCNGNGDGLIGADGASAYEMLRAWQQLANAGLVAGSYTGVSGPSTSQVIGTNVPVSKLPSAGWMIYGLGDIGSNSIFFAGSYGNILNVGPLSGASLKAEDAYNIDTKLDNGLPQSGKMRSYKNGAAPDCIVSSNDAYDVQNPNYGCMPLIITGY